MAFYGGLLGWEFEIRTPPGAPSAYAYARLDGLLVAGVGAGGTNDGAASGWTTYIWVESADETAAAVVAHGGQVLAGPLDIGRAGRVAVGRDPSGAVFGVWQAAENRGAELVNGAGSWKFSDLTTPDATEAQKFYQRRLRLRLRPVRVGRRREGVDVAGTRLRGVPRVTRSRAPGAAGGLLRRPTGSPTPSPS